jgi:ribose transport system substrate-binding protein
VRIVSSVFQRSGTPLRRVTRVRVAAACGVVALAVVTVSQAARSHAQAPVAAKKIALVVGISGLPYYTTMACGAKAAAKQEGVSLSVQGASAFTATAEQQVLQSVLLTKPNGLIVVPVDPVALNNTLSKTAAKIPVITTDLGLSKKIGVANIVSPGTKGGALAADYMAKSLGSKRGTIIVLSNSPTLVTTNLRAKGFVDRMKAKHPGFKLLPIQYAGIDPSGAAKIVANDLTAHADVVGVWAPFEPAVLGSASALAAAGKGTSVKLLGYDADAVEVQALKQGKIDALIVQAPYQMGFQSVSTIAKILKGTLKPSQVKYQQTTSLVLATRANVNTPQVQQFIYKGHC